MGNIHFHRHYHIKQSEKRSLKFERKKCHNDDKLNRVIWVKEIYWFETRCTHFPILALNGRLYFRSIFGKVLIAINFVMYQSTGLFVFVMINVFLVRFHDKTFIIFN